MALQVVLGLVVAELACMWRIAPRMNGGRYGASMRCITACAAYG